MKTIFEKLNLTTQKTILVAGAPPSFDVELQNLSGVQVISQPPADNLDYALVFVTKKEQIDAVAPTLASILPGDAIIWFAYPKSTSKKYRCDFNRDTGWDAVRALGFDSVRMVAIDEDWSALRFRRNEFIRSR